jgi:hypothetical protein
MLTKEQNEDIQLGIVFSACRAKIMHLYYYKASVKLYDWHNA